MNQKSARFGLSGWVGIAGGALSVSDWTLWAQNKLALQNALPRPKLETVPARISRRLDVLGRCVMSASEQCLPLINSDPAVISTSMHGDLPFMDKLVQTSRDYGDISPTAFTYSVHNRFSSLISIFSGYHGVNGAYSSAGDGFPLALAEAVSLIDHNVVTQALIVCFEPETPEAYQSIMSNPVVPHVVAFVISQPSQSAPAYSLVRHQTKQVETTERGSCLPFLRTVLDRNGCRDGYWGYQIG